jgi:hypothetical protein
MAEGLIEQPAGSEEFRVGVRATFTRSDGSEFGWSYYTGGYQTLGGAERRAAFEVENGVGSVDTWIEKSSVSWERV